MNIKNCPNCNSDKVILVGYNFVKCENCQMQGPKHIKDREWTAEYVDGQFVIEKWNNLPRRN